MQISKPLYYVFYMLIIRNLCYACSQYPWTVFPSVVSHLNNRGFGNLHLLGSSNYCDILAVYTSPNVSFCMPMFHLLTTEVT